MANSQRSIFPIALSTEWAAAADADLGEVFTRRWVVEFILDLAGYTTDKDLGAMSIVEPSCGSGAFLAPIVERLIASCQKHGRDLADTHGAIRAFDLQPAWALLARDTARVALTDAGLDHTTARCLANGWVHTADFLLADHELKSADFVVGNPPYIRLESVPPDVSDAYRRACPTMRGRADIYVGFFEVGLDLLAEGGSLAFICADRWMHNQYGSALRALVSTRFSVEAVIALHDAPVFEEDVSAYPAITVLRSAPQQRARVVRTNQSFGEAASRSLSRWVTGRAKRRPESASFEASELTGWFDGNEPWPTGRPSQLALLADLEKRFSPLESPLTNTRVGIGVATGCDEVFIANTADVEDDRLLPLLRAGDLSTGTPDWSGAHLVNPWINGTLVDLNDYPRLAAYLTRHEHRIRARHIAQKRPARWYRTIDVVDPSLLRRPKLVLPDMKAAAHPVLDEGKFYPHHNLYYVVSSEWDLEVLGGLLMSEICNLFVGSYCVKMRGGTYRFQAQYLRRIRVPNPESISTRDANGLRQAFSARDTERATALACRAFGLDPDALRW